jgi:hypothetical protein
MDFSEEIFIFLFVPPAPSLNYLTNTGVIITETNKKFEEI